MSGSLRKVFILFTLFTLLFPLAGKAFDYNNIISDAEANNYNSMDRSEVQDFLRTWDGYLVNYKYAGNNPSPSQVTANPDLKYIQSRSASEIIYNASQEAKINPQFLLTMLQKEQSLIEDDTPSERALNYAMGYYCFDNQYCNPRYKGFGKQVRSMALQFRYYIDNINEYKHQPGMSSCVDDQTPYLPCTSKATEVKPENNVTAALYVYTPHIHGNKLFHTLWEKYGFGGDVIDTEVPTFSGIFPDGALVKARDDDSPTIYLISGGTKRPFASMTALVSRYDPNKVLNVAADELENYTLGKTIDYANFSILEGASGNRYLIDGLIRRQIKSDEVFRQLGFNPEEVIEVTANELQLFTLGEELTTDSSPFAQVMEDMTTGSLHYIKDGQKAQIIDSSIFEANFPELEVEVVTSKTLEQFTRTGPVKLVDGALIKKDSNPNVYVISNGQRRLIPDGATFEEMGYTWTNILTVPTKVMNLHQVGQPLSL